MSTFDLPLPNDLREFIANKVASGDYASENEVVREAILLLRERDRVRSMRIEELRQDIQPALDQLDRGEGVPLDVEEIKRLGRKRQQHHSE